VAPAANMESRGPERWCGVADERGKDGVVGRKRRGAGKVRGPRECAREACCRQRRITRRREGGNLLPHAIGESSLGANSPGPGGGALGV